MRSLKMAHIVAVLLDGQPVVLRVIHLDPTGVLHAFPALHAARQKGDKAVPYAGSRVVLLTADAVRGERTREGRGLALAGTTQ
jgi:hypothetical protein